MTHIFKRINGINFVSNDVPDTSNGKYRTENTYASNKNLTLFITFTLYSSLQAIQLSQVVRMTLSIIVDNF